MENSYRMDPQMTFPKSAVHRILQEVLTSVIEDRTYCVSDVPSLTMDITAGVKTRVKSLNAPR